MQTWQKMNCTTGFPSSVMVGTGKDTNSPFSLLQSEQESGTSSWIMGRGVIGGVIDHSEPERMRATLYLMDF